MSSQLLFIKYSKIRPDAVAPSRENATDVGYDLTLIGMEKVSDEIFRFDTGIAVEPPADYYIDVVPRSSFSSTGYVLLNSVGVIDPEYRGSIKVTLMKVSKTAPDLKLPYRGFQLILRPLFNTLLVETRLSDTSRGANGFGSSGDVRNDMSRSAQVASSIPPAFVPTVTSSNQSTSTNYLFDNSGNVYS